MRLVTLLLFLGLLLSNKSNSRIVAVSHYSDDQKLNKIFLNGDIVLRSGKGFISDMMRNTSRNEKRFSHAGVIINSPLGPQVVHCIASEIKPEGGIVIQPLDEFINPTENNSFAIYRYPIDDISHDQVKKTVLEFIKWKVIFDKHFDLATDNAMYCSEFVYKVLGTATHNTIAIQPTYMEKGTYIGLDDLYLNKNCTLLIDSIYNK